MPMPRYLSADAKAKLYIGTGIWKSGPKSGNSSSLELFLYWIPCTWFIGSPPFSIPILIQLSKERKSLKNKEISRFQRLWKFTAFVLCHGTNDHSQTLNIYCHRMLLGCTIWSAKKTTKQIARRMLIMAKKKYAVTVAGGGSTFTPESRWCS